MCVCVQGENGELGDEVTSDNGIENGFNGDGTENGGMENGIDGEWGEWNRDTPT